MCRSAYLPGGGNLDEEMKLCIHVDAAVEGKIIEIIEGVKNIIGVERGEDLNPHASDNI